MNFKTILTALNSDSHPDHEAESWIHPTTGEMRLKIKFQGKHAGFIVNPDNPTFEGSFKKLAKINLDELEDSQELEQELSGDNQESNQENQESQDSTSMALNALNNKIYLVDIEIKGGVSALSIEWDHLGLEPDLIDSLKASKASKIKIPVFSKLSKALTRVRNERIRIYAKYCLYSAPWRYCTTNTVERFLEELECLKVESQQLKSEVIESLETEKRAYLASILKIIEQVIPDVSLQEYVLSVYADKFPDEEQVQENFTVTLTNFIEVPSLFEQVQDDTEKTNELAKNIESKALLNAKKEYAKTIQENLGTAIKESTRELYAILSETLTKISEAKSSQKAKDVCKKAMERVEIIAEFNPGIDSLKDAFGESVAAYASDDRTALDNALKSVKIALQGHKQAISELPQETREGMAKFMI